LIISIEEKLACKIVYCYISFLYCSWYFFPGSCAGDLSTFLLNYYFNYCLPFFFVSCVLLFLAYSQNYIQLGLMPWLFVSHVALFQFVCSFYMFGSLVCAMHLHRITWISPCLFVFSNLCCFSLMDLDAPSLFLCLLIMLLASKRTSVVSFSVWLSYYLFFYLCFVIDWKLCGVCLFRFLVSST